MARVVEKESVENLNPVRTRENSSAFISIEEHAKRVISAGMNIKQVMMADLSL